MVKKFAALLICEFCPRDIRGATYWQVFGNRDDLDEHVRKDHFLPSPE